MTYDNGARLWLLAMWIVIAALYLVPWASAGTKLTLRGKLFATEQEAVNGTFFIDPEGESESITIGAQGYVRDYLDGTVGHDVLITIEPR